MRISDWSSDVCSSDLERKPHPLPLLHSAQVLGIEPSQCAYVGDDERDIVAARAAGMPSVVALWGYRLDLDDPETWQGDALAETPRDLLDPAADRKSTRLNSSH